jgi:tRNA/rRNA methyltransferase/tRNA (cytidine32/uridine32-2'-O)-methyltransferase
MLARASQGRVAVLFGREDHGLPNEALDRAHAICTIPTTEHFSLNVAQACLLALYELHLLAGDATRRLPPPRHAAGTPPSEAVERAFADIEAALEAIAYFETRNRELVMLRTMSIEVLRTIERESRRAVREALAASGGPAAGTAVAADVPGEARG